MEWLLSVALIATTLLCVKLYQASRAAQKVHAGELALRDLRIHEFEQLVAQQVSQIKLLQLELNLLTEERDALLFDDVLWVENAKRDHFDFQQKLRDRGVDVVEMHNLLTETVAVPEGRKWILDHQVVPNQVGLGFIDELRSYLDGLPDRELAETLIGGLSTLDFPEKIGGAAQVRSCSHSLAICSW